MVSTNDIIAFVEIAMEKNLKINLYGFGGIRISNSEKDVKLLPLGNTLEIQTNSGSFNVTFTEEDNLVWKLLMLKVNKYRKNMGIKEFQNFFQEENKPLDINELDDKEED